MQALEGYSSHFVCLSVFLSVADLEYGGLLALQRNTNLKEYDDLNRFNLPLKFSLVLAKK